MIIHAQISQLIRPQERDARAEVQRTLEGTISDLQASSEADRQQTQQLATELSTATARLQQADTARAKSVACHDVSHIVNTGRLEAQLEMEREAHAVTKAELSSSQAGASQNAMLDLELADYQRTVDTLNRHKCAHY